MMRRAGDITFASGQSATGSFSIDQAAGTLSDWKIQVSGGSNPSLTNLSFLPGANCVVFCGELFDAGNVPSPSGLDVRTGLMPDNTFFELNLYFNAPLSAILQPGLAAITVNGGSHLDRALLVDPNHGDGLGIGRIGQRRGRRARDCKSQRGTGTFFGASVDSRNRGKHEKRPMPAWRALAFLNCAEIRLMRRAVRSRSGRVRVSRGWRGASSCGLLLPGPWSSGRGRDSEGLRQTADPH